jgi:transcriptional regulator with XRE-family HTH domain
MTLKEWLDREAMSVPQFATRIGRSAEAVRRYVSGERIPDKDTMPLIAEATQRKVTPNDFFDLPPVKRRRSMPSQVAA